MGKLGRAKSLTNFILTVRFAIRSRADPFQNRPDNRCGTVTCAIWKTTFREWRANFDQFQPQRRQRRMTNRSLCDCRIALAEADLRKA